MVRLVPAPPACFDAGVGDDGYRLIDSGGGRKLEAFGPVLLDRPVAYAVWDRDPAKARDWDRAAGIYHRSESGGGSWEWRQKTPESWTLAYGGLTFSIKPTPFGHLGLFAEQAENWAWLRRTLARLGEGLEVINMFAYTGGSTLACAQAGAKVCHLDSSQGAVTWARLDAQLSGLAEKPIRWIVEDVGKFVGRELKRGRRYHGFVLDPPSYGRGAKGEIFKIEDDLPRLLAGCRDLAGSELGFILLSCHSDHFSPAVLSRLLAGYVPAGTGTMEAGEMVIPEEGGRVLPSGVFARWSRA